MTINVFTIVWNEQFMLPKFLDHYSQFVDRIFVIDDHSTDLTPLIANNHPMVNYSEYQFKGLNEKEFNDTFESFYKTYPSTWAIAVDADEFIMGLDALEHEPPGVLRTKGYMMIGKTGKLEDCKKIRMQSFDKPVVFDPTLNVRFGDGRHSATPTPRSSDLELWHYKYPSREYYKKRNKLAYPRIMNKKQTEYRLKRGLRWFDDHV